jgi:predicted nucleic acid-binding protein
MDEWLRHPRVQVVNELPQHWAVFQPLLNSTGAAGNLTSDVHLAALAISHDATLVTCDHDFRRFPQLKTIDPTTVSEEGPA